MRAISLWQPWASAIAFGIKRVETRQWMTAYRGPIAIHAGKRWEADQLEFARAEQAVGRLPLKLPLGAFVAVARLADIRPTAELAGRISELERSYGNYRAGRYGWILEDIEPLTEPIAWRGAQGIFFVPDRILQDHA